MLFSKDAYANYQAQYIKIVTIAQPLSQPFYSGANVILTLVLKAVPPIPPFPIPEVRTILLLIIGIAIAVVSVVKRRF